MVIVLNQNEAFLFL